MRFFRRGCAAILVLSLVALVGPPARAVEALRFEDPAGDQLDARGSMDLVSVTLEVKPMAPRNTLSMVTTFELSAPAEQLMVSYDMSSTIPGCGSFSASYRPGTLLATAAGSQLNQYFMNCGFPETTGTGTAGSVPASAKLDGNKVIVWAAMSAFPKEIIEGAELTNISATTQVSEPVFGIIGNSAILAPTDEATTDKSWRFV